MKFLLAICFFGFVAVVHSSIYSDVVKKEWELYKEKYGKTYDDVAEDGFRMNIFLQRKMEIAEHNKLYEQGQRSYELEVNHFADLEVHEQNQVNGFIMPEEGIDSKALMGSPHDTIEDIPENVDWTKKGAVNPVQNQQRCGSCWAFSAIGALEGQLYIKTKKLVKLSEQQLVDCNKVNHGCQGGWPHLAFNYIRENNGSEYDSEYPYYGHQLSVCYFDKRYVGGTDRGYYVVKQFDEENLKKAVALGPVSVAIDARPVMYYRGGILDARNCSQTQLNHAVLAVGYGVDAATGIEYWKIKNSWGERWGESGYFRMVRNKKNMCGIATVATFPAV